MYNNMRLYAYNQYSNSAKALSQALGIKRIKHEGSKYVPRPHHTIINWGCGENSIPNFGCRVLNRPELVGRASNKLDFFQHLGSTTEVSIPDWTTDPTQARSWVVEGYLVVARTILRGHSGAGIVLCDSEETFVQAPLYTKYVKKESEYRVHCGFGRCIDVQRKIKRPDFDGTPNWRIRNHQNGFIYVRNDVHPPQEVTNQALQAFKASGLHFGAVDVIWNAHQGRAYVLELNTAPGLVGQTVQSYSEAISQAAASGFA